MTHYNYEVTIRIVEKVIGGIVLSELTGEHVESVYFYMASTNTKYGKPYSPATIGDAVMCDQYLGIGIPAPLYADKYDELGLSRNMLSRTLEDAGTMWSPLFPWTACGAYQMSVLGLNPFVYFPFAFVNLLSPLYAFATAALGRNIFWADGSCTNILGKTRKGKPAACPEEVREVALANLEARREQGLAPRPQD